MAEEVQVGDRVRVSKGALSRGIFKRCPPGRLGEVLTSRPGSRTVCVWWDGRRSAESVARLFVEKVLPE